METKLTQATETLVAYHAIAQPLNCLYKRASRKIDELATEVYSRLKNKEHISEGASVEAKLSWKDARAARGYALAVEEFCQESPKKYGDRLKAIIKKQRSIRRNYLEFGGEVSNKMYLQTIQELGGFNLTEARRILETAKDISDKLNNKKKEGLTKRLMD